MKSNKGIIRLRPRYILLCCLAGLVVFGALRFAQQKKLDEILLEQQALEVQYEQLLLEEQRLTHMVDYSKTDDYLEQLAREKLGYVSPDDYKFYMDENEITTTE
ncbi:cell division protein FtsL [Eubacteriales bacterium OttesenSCG-928-K08]|nr:cell division protein FtsL [Eubacteriales bacterium OttesenSCG-928-K08]